MLLRSKHAGTCASGVFLESGRILTAGHFARGACDTTGKCPKLEIRGSAVPTLLTVTAKVEKHSFFLDAAILEFEEQHSSEVLGAPLSRDATPSVTVIGFPQCGDRSETTHVAKTARGFELELKGEFSPGASGSAVYSSDGNLLGIVTKSGDMSAAALRTGRMRTGANHADLVVNYGAPFTTFVIDKGAVSTGAALRALHASYLEFNRAKLGDAARLSESLWFTQKVGALELDLSSNGSSFLTPAGKSLPFQLSVEILPAAELSKLETQRLIDELRAAFLRERYGDNQETTRILSSHALEPFEGALELGARFSLLAAIGLFIGVALWGASVLKTTQILADQKSAVRVKNFFLRMILSLGLNIVWPVGFLFLLFLSRRKKQS